MSITIRLYISSSLKKMKCCIRGCSSSGMKNNTYSFHKFPLDRMKTWTKLITTLNLQTLNVTRHTKICSLHFEDSSFVGYNREKRNLSCNACPSIFPFFNPNESESLEILDLVEVPQSLISLNFLEVASESNEFATIKSEIIDEPEEDDPLALDIDETSKDDCKTGSLEMLPNIVSWDETNKPFMQLIAMPSYTYMPGNQPQLLDGAFMNNSLPARSTSHVIRYPGDIKVVDNMELDECRAALSMLEAKNSKAYMKICMLNSKLLRSKSTHKMRQSPKLNTMSTSFHPCDPCDIKDTANMSLEQCRDAVRLLQAKMDKARKEVKRLQTNCLRSIKRQRKSMQTSLD